MRGENRNSLLCRTENQNREFIKCGPTPEIQRNYLQLNIREQIQHEFRLWFGKDLAAAPEPCRSPKKISPKRKTVHYESLEKCNMNDRPTTLISWSGSSL